ncbi:hypothetical protein CEUSTIGMA_g12882.t1 [Chlamydomonas eustigma]|uniref:V-type proton ATPase subunit a n=1 Tax=Chlamydomonas eustigma TaxID=1157962 RepID=A0A250XQZ0_9CHLO|nr:hypothetical protein CEUSTIGMA_g12882.t1 [Chlamydomonas eustigma]|eukprot:GAX85466.1 hypothetical protein CEUSTIGMA_g12882.t1 [Chlamydomonas eustigma]
MQRLFDFGFEHIDIWRSEPMTLAQLMIPAESAHDTIEALGDIGMLQFKDLNTDKSAFQRNYASQVKRCDELARKLRFFQEQVDKAGVKLTAVGPDAEEKTVQFDELELKLEDTEKELLEINSNTEKLQRAYAELNEMQQVLEKAGGFFDQKTRFGDVTIESYDRSFGIDVDTSLLEGGAVGDKTSKVGFLAGTIQQDKVNAFERLLFRATRGNLFLKSAPLEELRDPASGEVQKKSVFVVFFAGERSRQKAQKICDAFSANRYPFPEDVSRQRQMHGEVTARLRELQSTNEASERQRDLLMHSIATGLDGWTTLVRREKAVYHTMNKLSLDVTSKVLIAEVWVPVAAMDRIQDVLNVAAENSNTLLRSIIQPLNTAEEPPTHYETNKFTECFQTIVEAYGVARYREVNPAVLTIMTFPFLFAVMFGDWGHATLMLLFAGFMLYKEKSLMGQDLGDMVGMLFGGRYCILLMGLYSIYTGFIYNEWFSMPTYMFGHSHFVCYNSTNQVVLYPPVAPAGWGNATYPGSLMQVGMPVDPRDCTHFGGTITFPYGSMPFNMGVDPMWHGRKTELPYLNSLKMKMSILIGVTHMNFGILMSLFNNLNNRDMLSTICEFIPQMIFLNSIFGYLCLLITVKWVTGQYADLYNVLIRMFLGLGDVLPANQLFSGQKGLQQFLLAIAFISVPCMLVPKPLILKKRWEESQKGKAQRAVEMSSSHAYDEDDGRRPEGGHGSSGNLLTKSDPEAGHGGGGGHGHGHGDHFEFGEVMVHQMIHTIEFVLGAVSNTASYLRLWALSLAHSQLSAVFFDKVLMQVGLQYNNPIILVVCFFIFALATLGVLMVMESLSAFLHALRLHWVEYMNKFYKGDGYKFVPFSFALLAEEEKEGKA